ncbi:sulfite oxidase-like protein [Bimuria novae-zelandiae CBS 107.79]|uniref:Sulfite oxidase-like protein n=1 Tax=Bimuria novae-zelandiae CBS 107.79 TaxID=1447943 RepID=A0A6A5V0X7_9PLEO|nr:sulfite oxidase-like protein [Bimuria novae-zelandiae CBS 107.79]
MLEYSVEEPLNREPKVDKLVSSFITGEGEGYDRNHGPIPHINTEEHRVKVDGLVEKELSLSIEDLKMMGQKTIICALQCAGNRRHTMRTKLKEVTGIDWFDGAVMNCSWTGPLLREVLQKAALKVPKEAYDSTHVAFACHQTPTQDDQWYGASVPLSRVMDSESGIILALQMNGKPLSPNHGAPVRVVTPGIAGARSVKWLDKITVQECESENFYQRHDYKILPPEAETKEDAEKWWDRVAALQDMPINSVIAVPSSDSTVCLDDNSTMEVKGYALPSGSDGPITKVEVSTDGGVTWQAAELLKDSTTKDADLKWAWCLWKARVKIAKGKGIKVLSRATDKSGNTQEACAKWNLRGVAYNGYGEASGLTVV